MLNNESRSKWGSFNYEKFGGPGCSDDFKKGFDSGFKRGMVSGIALGIAIGIGIQIVLVSIL